MERYITEKVEIVRLITEIMKYFDDYNDDGWKEFFEAILKRCHSGYPFKDICGNIVRAYRGGMGSFDDFILCKNDQMPIKENDALYALKGNLFELCNDVFMEGRVISFKKQDSE